MGQIMAGHSAERIGPKGKRDAVWACRLCGLRGPIGKMMKSDCPHPGAGTDGAVLAAVKGPK